MSGGISRIPAGLLGFLGIKNNGQYPQRLTQDLVPTWDLAQLYLEYGWRLGGDAGTVNNTGYVPVAVCPPGEVWCLHDIGMTIACGAAEAWTGAICRSGTNGGTTVNISDSQAVGASASISMIAPHAPVYITPGENLGLITLSFAGVVDYYLTYRYSILTM